jgi:hypothetical protein
MEWLLPHIVGLFHYYGPAAKSWLCKQVIAMEHPQLPHAQWQTTVQEVMQVVLSVRPLWDYMTQPTMSCGVSECSAVEGFLVEC